jgi:hypothetical protein
VTVVFRSGWEWIAVEGNARACREQRLIMAPTTVSPRDQLGGHAENERRLGGGRSTERSTSSLCHPTGSRPAVSPLSMNRTSGCRARRQLGQESASMLSGTTASLLSDRLAGLREADAVVVASGGPSAPQASPPNTTPRDSIRSDSPAANPREISSRSTNDSRSGDRRGSRRGGRCNALIARRIAHRDRCTS